MATASNYDYTRDQASQGTPFDGDAADEFVIPDVAAPQTSAAEIEMAKSFNEIPPGDYELVVIGFLNPPKAERKDVYVNSRRLGFETHSVIVKFGLASDPSYQATDFFLLPPGDPNGLLAYYEGSKNADGKNKGFMASKFYHFVERLGFPYPKGGSLPEAARKLGNWKGRTIHATIEPGDDYADQTTGETKAGRAQIKLFSYRSSGATVSGAHSAAVPASSFNRPRQPTHQAADPRTRQLAEQQATAVADGDYETAAANRDEIDKREKRSAGPPIRPQTAAPANRGPVAPRGLDNI